MPSNLSASSRSLRLSVSIAFSPHAPYTDIFVFEKLSTHFLLKQRHHLDALKSCTSLLENVAFRVTTRNVRDFLMYSLCPPNKHRFSAWWAYAASIVGKGLHMFVIGAVSLNNIL
jgi:hypothetical protein